MNVLTCCRIPFSSILPRNFVYTGDGVSQSTSGSCSDAKLGQFTQCADAKLLSICSKIILKIKIWFFSFPSNINMLAFDKVYHPYSISEKSSQISLSPTFVGTELVLNNWSPVPVRLQNCSNWKKFTNKMKICIMTYIQQSFNEINPIV